jgi:hypothetical protein
MEIYFWQGVEAVGIITLIVCFALFVHVWHQKRMEK